MCANRQSTNLHLRARQAWCVLLWVHLCLFLPAYQAWGSAAAVCPFGDSDAAGMQGLETSSSPGMWHHPASAPFSDLTPTLVSRARRVKHSAAGQGSRLCSPRCWLPSPSLPNHADIPFPIVSVKPPWEPCEPGRENRSSSENSSLLSHSQCRCSQVRLGTEVGITWCCWQTVYDINLLL